MKRNVILGLGAAALTTLALASCGGDVELPTSNLVGDTVNVVQIIEGKNTAGGTWDPEVAATGVEAALTKYGKGIDIVLSNNDGMALGVMANKTFKEHKVPLFGVDALDDAISAIKAGTLQGTIKNDSYTQAKVVLQAALNLTAGKNITEGMTFENMPGIYTKDDGSVLLEEETKALRVHHQMVTQENVNSLTTPEKVSDNTIGAKNSENKFFALTYNNGDPNMSGLWKPGFNDFGKELGATVQWTDGKNDDAAAIEAVKQAAQDKTYDAFLINPVDNSNGTSYINAIRQHNKTAPIIIWNREIPQTQMTDANTYYVGIESAEGGRLQGQMAAEYIKANGGLEKFDRNGDGRLGTIVLLGEGGHPDAEARTENAPKYLDKVLAAKK